MNLVGTWNLEVATPFGKHPATLTFDAAGGALSAHIDSRLGVAPLEGLTVTHDGFDARVQMDFQGRPYEASIKGQVENNDSLSGVIKVKLAIAPPIRYTGTRAAPRRAAPCLLMPPALLGIVLTAMRQLCRLHFRPLDSRADLFAD